MFYATKIQSVGYGYATDIHGKSLSFIGVLPVKAGDTVYTDGNIIFGHVPPRGAPAVFDELSGIPVLADDLRGYFTLQGVYKKYRIAGDYWITNGAKIYQHDSGNSTIIDAEIARDEKDNEIGCYTATKNILLTSSESDTANDDNFYYLRYDNTLAIWSFKDRAEKSTSETQVKAFELSAANADYAKCDDDIIKECTIDIKKDDSTFQSVQLSTLVKDIEDEIFKYVKIEIPAHEIEDHIKSRAAIQTFKILDNGDWHAIIFVETLVERYTKPNPYMDYSVGGSHSTSHLKINLNKQYNYQASDEPEKIVAQFNALGWTTLTVDDVKYISGLSNAYYHFFYDATKPYIMTIDTASYSAGSGEIKNADREFLDNTAAYNRGLYLISSNGTTEKLFQKCVFAPLDMVESSIENYGLANVANTKYDTTNNFPYVSSHYETATLNGTEQTVIIYNLWGINPMKTFNTGGINSTPYDRFFYHYDSRKLADAPDYKNGINYAVQEFFFPVQDDYSVKLINSQEKNYWTFGGIFDEDGNQVVGAIFNNDYVIAHTDNYSFVPLKDNSYLLGLRTKQIFKIDSSGVAEEIADNLRNFRLRELKKISVAKK